MGYYIEEAKKLIGEFELNNVIKPDYSTINNH